MIQLIAVLVMIDVVAIGGGVRAAGRARRTRRPCRPTVTSESDDPPPSTWRHAAGPATRLAVGVLTIGAIATVVAGPVLGLALAGFVVAFQRLRSISARRHARVEIERSLPDTIELLVLLIHAGLTPVQAVRELSVAAPLRARHGFAAVVHRLDRGEDFSGALVALRDHFGSGAVGLTDVIASADRNGLPLAPVLESLALEARSARRRRHEADARRLPVRLSFPLVVCTLPSFVLLAIAPAVIAALSSISLSV